MDKSEQKPVSNDDDNHNDNGDGSIVSDNKRKASDNIDNVNNNNDDNDNNDNDDNDNNDNNDDNVNSVMNIPPKKRQVFIKMKDKKYLQAVEKRAPRIGSDYQAQL
jgi:hypothetical protein